MVNASELTATITAIANYLASQLTQDQLELLGGESDPVGRHAADNCYPKEYMR